MLKEAQSRMNVLQRGTIKDECCYKEAQSRMNVLQRGTIKDECATAIVLVIAKLTLIGIGIPSYRRGIISVRTIRFYKIHYRRILTNSIINVIILK